METLDILQKVIDYIEENLKAELNSEELAALAGFSNYHFLHVFGSVVGMPLAAYITRPRIKHAIYDVYKGEKLIDTALLYGFDTHAGFFKAWNINDKYVFKTGTNIAGLRTHIAIAEALSKEGMNSAYQIKTKDGKDFIEEEGRYYVLFNFVEGRYLTPEERYEGNRETTGEKYGKAIGKLHQVLKKQEDTLYINDVNLYEDVINWAMPETKRIMEQWNSPLPEEFYEDYKANFGRLYGKLPRHIIHRNPNPTNILFKENEISGFIDFDISQKNVRLFDPCYCATGILSEAGKIPEGYDKWPELLKGIIKGYDSICPLNQEEKEAILYVIYSIQMIFIAYLDGRHEEKATAMENRKMLLWIWENADKLKM